MLRRTLELNKYSRNKTAPVEAEKERHEEYQYLNLISDILAEGVMEYGRNGNAKSVTGSVMHFSLEGGVFPLLTTKRSPGKRVPKNYSGSLAAQRITKYYKTKRLLFGMEMHPVSI